MNIRTFFTKHTEFLRYAFWGTLTTIVNLFFFHIFNIAFGEGYHLITNVLSWCITVAFAFITNKLWVFRSKSWQLNIVFKELFGFISARLFSLIIEELGLWLTVDVMDMESIKVRIISLTVTGILIAKVILQVVVVLANYIFSKFIIFTDKNRAKVKSHKPKT